MALVLTNTQIEDYEAFVDDRRRLESRIEELQVEIERLTLQLDKNAQRDTESLHLIDGLELDGEASAGARSPSGKSGLTIYELADDDAEAAAFDKFFNAPDPRIEKIRAFLMD